MRGLLCATVFLGAPACNNGPAQDTDSPPSLDPGVPIEFTVHRRSNNEGETIAAGPIDPADGELVGLPQLDARLGWTLSPAGAGGARWFVAFSERDSETLVFHQAYLGTTTLYPPSFMDLEGGVGLSGLLEKPLVWGESSGDLYAMHSNAFVHRIDVDAQVITESKQLDYDRLMFWARFGDRQPLPPDERWAFGTTYAQYSSGSYYLFSLETGEELRWWTPYQGSSPRWLDSSDLYVIKPNGQVAILQAPDFSEHYVRLPLPRTGIESIDFAPNGERCVVAVRGGGDTCTTAFGYDDGQTWVQVAEVSAKACVEATWSPDSRFAILLEDRHSGLEYPQEPQGIRVLRGSDGAIGTFFASGVASRVQWSPDSRSASLTRCNRIEDGADGEPPTCAIELWTDFEWSPGQAAPSARLVRTFSTDSILQFAP